MRESTTTADRCLHFAIELGARRPAAATNLATHSEFRLRLGSAIIQSTTTAVINYRPSSVPQVASSLLLINYSTHNNDLLGRVASTTTTSWGGWHHQQHVFVRHLRLPAGLIIINTTPKQQQQGVKLKMSGVCTYGCVQAESCVCVCACACACACIALLFATAPLPLSPSVG